MVEVKPGKQARRRGLTAADWRAGRSTAGAAVNGEKNPPAGKPMTCLQSEKQYRLILRNETPELGDSRLPQALQSLPFRVVSGALGHLTSEESSLQGLSPPSGGPAQG